MAVTALDLEHAGLPGAISAWLVEADGPALVDPGPSTTLEALEAGLEAVGLSLDEVRHVLLTHVHLDHAGATGHLTARLPRLRVHIHEEAARHLVEPARLVASTRRTFGAEHDRLWGEVRPVPADRIRAWRAEEGREAGGLRGLATPGHIDHHVAWLDERDGTLLAGDCMGIVLDPAAPSHPPTPPPGVDLAAWRRTLETVASVGPERVAVAHFGLHQEVEERVRQLRRRLDALESRVERALAAGRDEDDAEGYEQEVRAEQSRTLPRERVDRYFDAFRAATDYHGVVRYVRKRRESRERGEG